MTHTDEPMEAWRKVWRTGVAPLLSTRGLELLHQGLMSDDKRLIQGGTTEPPPFHCVQDWPVEAACAIGYCGVDELGGFGIATVGEVETMFAKTCYECDNRLGEPAGCRHWLNWWDSAPRMLAFSLLMQEVNREIEIRSSMSRLEKWTESDGDDVSSADGTQF